MSVFSSPPHAGTEALCCTYVHFWELLFKASKNVQAGIRPFLWFRVKLIPLKPDSVFTALLTWMINNQSDWHPFLQLKRLSKELPEAESLPPTNPILILCFPKVWWNYHLNKFAYQKHLKAVLIIAMIYLGLSKWWPKCSPCAKSLNGCFICIQSPEEGVTLTYQSGKWKLAENPN